MKRTIFALLAVSGLSVCSHAALVDINITNFQFVDPSGDNLTTIQVGDSVRWTNNDFGTHTATAMDNSFDTGDLANGQSETIQFNQIGSFDYRCMHHQFMTGNITVVPEPATLLALSLGAVALLRKRR